MADVEVEKRRNQTQEIRIKSVIYPNIPNCVVLQKEYCILQPLESKNFKSRPEDLILVKTILEQSGWKIEYRMNDGVHFHSDPQINPSHLQNTQNLEPDTLSYHYKDIGELKFSTLSDPSKIYKLQLKDLSFRLPKQFSSKDGFQTFEYFTDFDGTNSVRS